MSDKEQNVESTDVLDKTTTIDSVTQRVNEAVETTGFYTYEEERKLLRKVDLKLMPLLILLYLLKNLDVNNVSYLTTLNVGTKYNVLKELNMTRDEWAWTSTIYFIPFILFEVPSTLLLKKSTPRLHQFRIAFLWGATTACQAAVKNKHGLYALRFLLGLFEAGLYPAQLAQLTYWYRSDEITTRMAFLGVLGSFSNILTAFITYGFSFASGKSSLSAWRLVFLVEGLLTVVLSFLILFYLSNYPDDAKWLTKEESAFLLARLPPTAPKSSDKAFNRKEAVSLLRNPSLILFALLRLFQNLGTYGLSFWLPSIVQKFGLSSTETAPLLSIPSAAVSVIAGIVFSYGVDRAILKPQYVVIFALSLAFVSFCVLAFVESTAARYAFIIIATLAASADGSVFSSWINQILNGATQVGLAMSITNGIAQIGGIIGPQLFRTHYGPKYTIPYGVCLAFIGAGIVVTIILWYRTNSYIRETFYAKKQRLAERKKDKNDKPIYNHNNGDLEIVV